MTFQPFTDNIIFYDAEFSSLDPYVGEILSIGLVKQSGEELYLELEYEGDYSQWVQDHLLHTLTSEKVSRSDAKKQIEEFVDGGQPYLLSYINDFDVLYLKKLMCEGSVPYELGPFHWLPLDFASILVGLGYDPEVYMQDDYQKLTKELGVNTTGVHTHNALDDAKLLREVYLALVNK